MNHSSRLSKITSEIKSIEESIRPDSWNNVFELIMRENRFSTICESLEFIINNERKHLKNIIPSTYHKNWVIASLKMSIKKLRYADALMRKMVNGKTYHPNISYVQDALKSAYRHMEQAVGILRTQEIRKKIKEDEDNSLLLSEQNLKHGDILMSYKTGKYLKKHFLSKLIGIVAKTNFTHSSMVCIDNSGDTNMLNCAAEDVEVNGVSVEKIRPREGEVFIVLRIKEDFSKKNDLIQSFDKWVEKAKKRNTSTKDENYFSELKCWMACTIGFVHTNSILLGGFLVKVPNIFYKSKGLFCSEIIDVIFKDTDTILMPRAEYNAILGPSDIIYSPFLEFKGILGNKEDIDLMKKEKILM